MHGCGGAVCWTTAISELSILSEHAVAIDALPPIHRDPFDRLLVAQATVEGNTLLTVDSRVHLLTHDRVLAAYSKLVVLV